MKGNRLISVTIFLGCFNIAYSQIDSSLVTLKEALYNNYLYERLFRTELDSIDYKELDKINQELQNSALDPKDIFAHTLRIVRDTLTPFIFAEALCKLILESDSRSGLDSLLQNIHILKFDAQGSVMNTIKSPVTTVLISSNRYLEIYHHILYTEFLKEFRVIPMYSGGITTVSLLVALFRKHYVSEILIEYAIREKRSAKELGILNEIYNSY